MVKHSAWFPTIKRMSPIRASIQMYRTISSTINNLEVLHISIDIDIALYRFLMIDQAFHLLCFRSAEKWEFWPVWERRTETKGEEVLILFRAPIVFPLFDMLDEYWRRLSHHFRAAAAGVVFFLFIFMVGS